jgi:invasion protein IalB
VRRVLPRCFGIFLLAGLCATPATSEEAGPPTLTYSPWTKLCLNETCFVGRDGRTDCDAVVAAILIEKKGETKRTLRITMPPRVNVARGVRITIDQDQPIARPFERCFASGCMADYEAGAEQIDQLRRGRMLVLEAIDAANVPISLSMPLADFAEAYDGPSHEPRALEEQTSPQQMRASQKSTEEERSKRCGPSQ